MSKAVSRSPTDSRASRNSLADIDLRVLGRIGVRLAGGTLGDAGLVGVDLAVAVGALVDGVGEAVAVRTAGRNVSSPQSVQR